MRRHGIAQPAASTEEYAQLFRNLQPVSPIHNTRPGSSPCLEHRADFDDQKLTDSWRANHTIIKGRFQRGLIGYIFQEDLELYANAFAKPIKAFSEAQSMVWECVSHLGPVNKGVIKEETGLLMKQISPALNRLQEAFMVYQDQIDDNWECGWESVESQWPELDVAEHKRHEARKQVLLRFLDAHVFATPTQLRDWSGFPLKALRAMLQEFEQEHLVEGCEIDGLGDGWRMKNAANISDAAPWQGVRVLSKADLLCRSHESELKARFRGLETLCYLLIDGEFAGTVTGHWGFGAYPLDDIVVCLPNAEKQARKAEILTAVTHAYAADEHQILRYSGEPL